MDDKLFEVGITSFLKFSDFNSLNFLNSSFSFCNSSKTFWEYSLNLEKENYKITLTIYLNKLQCFELLKNEDDDYKLLQKEKQIATMKSNLFSIREEINDFITNLKYKYLH